MGMFDYIRCEHELPAPDAQGLEFQTKDTDAQWCDQYVIRPDGTLWHETYDIEDRSDPKAEGLSALIGIMTKVKNGWESCEDFTGEIRFYKGGDYNTDKGWWLEFSAYFKRGQLQQVNLVSDTRAAARAVPGEPT